MQAKQVLRLILVGIVSTIVGYFLGYFLFSNTLIDVFAGRGTGEWERGVIGDIGMQLCCGAPLPVWVGFALAVLTILIDRFIKIPSTTRIVIVAIIGLVSGFISYFPWQIILLMGAAF